MAATESVIAAHTASSVDWQAAARSQASLYLEQGVREPATLDCSADKSDAVQFTPFRRLKRGREDMLAALSGSVSRQPRCFTQSSRGLSFKADAAFCTVFCGQGPAAGRNGDNPAARTLMHGHRSFATLGAQLPLPRGCPHGCQRTLLCRTGRQANKACPFATSWPQGLAARSQKNGGGRCSTRIDNRRRGLPTL